MNTLHWSWGLSTALILTLVIWLNANQIRAGWLLGAAVQFINMGFGLAYGQWTFAFLALPASMFVFIYFRRARPVKPQPLLLPEQERRSARARLRRHRLRRPAELP